MIVEWLLALALLTPTERWACQQRYDSLQRQIERTADPSELSLLLNEREIVADLLNKDDELRLKAATAALRGGK